MSAPAHAADVAFRSLRRLPLLEGLADADVAHLAAVARRVEYAPGEAVLAQGSPADGLYVLVRGRVEVTRTEGGEEVVLAESRPGTVLGEMALLGGAVRCATVRATTPAAVLVLEPVAAQALLAAQPAIAWRLLHTMAARQAATETIVGRRERLAALGTLAAGLAHELNNPAAALARSAAHQARAVFRLEAAALALGVRPAAARRAEDLVASGAAVGGLEVAPRLPALTAGDRAATADPDAEDRLAAWLAARAVPEPWLAAEALAACSWDAVGLDRAGLGLDAPDQRVLFDWLAARCAVGRLAAEAAAAAAAIRDVVGAVRTHAHMDRAPLAEIDVRDGIAAALVLLRHRLRPGVAVTVDIADDVPRIEAFAGELNQVWSNLIANAVDAMRGHGRLRVRGRRRGGRIVLDIIDDGPGIPAAVRGRIFDPFFTTRADDGGTGLGLHIARSIVVHRHGGRLDVRSRPGCTIFRVILPVRPGG
jgi:signal transduction histidine kinase